MRATACVVIPLVVLCALGHPQEGAIATQGGFAGLYAFDEPYRRRSKLVLGIGVSLAVAMALGTLAAPTPALAVLLGALVAAVAAAACLAARVGPPREYFIIFTFLIATSLPSDPAAAPERAAFVLLGVAFAWAVSMAGALRDGERPERSAVDGAYRAVARLLHAIGRPGAEVARHEAVVAVQRAFAAVDAAGGDERAAGPALLARAEGAERLLEAALALSLAGSPPLDPAWGHSVATLADGALAAVMVPSPTAAPSVPEGARLVAALRAVSSRPAAGPDPGRDGPRREGARLPWRASLAEISDRNSIVRVAALRVGIAVGVAGAVGYLLRAEHPQWIPLSTAAVLQGTNIALARQRAVQRAGGTAIGVVIAAGVLALRPGLAVLVALVALFQALTEALILVSYGAAVVCITSLALLLLEIAGVGTSVSGLLDARLVDTALGCGIGLAAGLLLWPRRSRERLAGTQGATIRTAAAALRAGLAGHPPEELRRRRRALQVSVVGLGVAQRDAIGDEVRAADRADLGWPVTHAAQELAFLALSLPRTAAARVEDHEAVALHATLHGFADRAEGRRDAPVPDPPPLPHLPRTQRAIDGLRDVLDEFGAAAAAPSGVRGAEVAVRNRRPVE
jgi:uncharacterized membrane protein YccC